MAKVMISMPDDLLAQVDAEAKRRGTTRSGLLRELAEREVERESDTRAADVDRLLSAATFPGDAGFDVVDAIRQARQDRTRRLAGG